MEPLAIKFVPEFHYMLSVEEAMILKELFNICAAEVFMLHGISLEGWSLGQRKLTPTSLPIDNADSSFMDSN
jgi:hypothetical protein